ncbi:hypothetical protein JCM10213_005549 [Rhodosporidiobolus nylandii]
MRSLPLCIYARDERLIVLLAVGGKASASQDVVEGLNLLSVEFSAGATGVSLQDSTGAELLSGSGSDIQDSPSSYDYNFKSYIVPDTATASAFLDISSPSPGDSASLTQSSRAASETTEPATQTIVGGNGASAASTSPRASTSSDGGPRSTVSPDAAASASSRDDGELPAGGTTSSSALDITAAGLPLWGWLAGILGFAAATIAVCLFIMHGRAKPSTSRAGGQESASCSGSSSSQDSDSEGSSGVDVKRTSKR